MCVLSRIDAKYSPAARIPWLGAGQEGGGEQAKTLASPVAKVKNISVCS